MAQHGKRYNESRGAIDRENLYSPVEAIRLLKGSPEAKFDETVEVHMNLGLNVRHADEQLRGTMMLPHGTGCEQRVAVFAEGEKAKEAEAAGADIVGSADLAKRIEEGFTDFDLAIATPDQMGTVGRLSKDQLRSIAETKMQDLNARDLDQAMLVIAGTARSMGVEVES